MRAAKDSDQLHVLSKLMWGRKMSLPASHDLYF